MTDDNMPQSLFGKPIVYTDESIAPEGFFPVVFGSYEDLSIPCDLVQEGDEYYLVAKNGSFKIRVIFDDSDVSDES